MNLPAVRADVQGAERACLLAAALCSLPAFAPLPFLLSGIAAGLLVFVPWVILSVRQRRLIVNDVFPIVGLVVVMGVTLPALFPDYYKDRMWSQLPLWAIDDAALWIYRGWAVASVTYWTTRAFNPASYEVTLAEGRSRFVEGNLRRVIGLLGAVGAGGYLVATRGAASSFLENDVSMSSNMQMLLLLSQLSVVYIYLYFHARSSGMAMRSMDHYLIIAIIVLQMATFLMTGSKTPALQVLAAWALGAATSAKRPGIPRELTIAAVSVFFIICASYLVNAYRSESRLREPPASASLSANLFYQLDTMGSAIHGLVEGREYGDDRNSYGVSDILDRFAVTMHLAMVLDYLNGVPPYENAWESFATPVLAFVPRSMVEAKVHFVDSGDFAQMNGWDYGGLSLTIQGSLIWAWGYEGVLVGFGVLGILLAWLTARANFIGEKGIIARSTLLVIALTLLNSGIEFQSLVVITVRTIALLIVARLATDALGRSMTPVSSTGAGLNRNSNLLGKRRRR